MSKRIDTTEVAKIIRSELKKNFPACKFTVKSSRYSGGSSIRVHWQDGPTDAQVNSVIGHFKGASFDAMIDLKSYHDTEYQGEKVHFGNDYLFTERGYSFNLLTECAKFIAEKWGRPTPEVLTDGEHAYICDDGECVSQTWCYDWTMRNLILKQARETSIA